MVWGVHLMSNYAECNNPESILHLLIPMDAEGHPEQCTMFIEHENAVDPRQGWLDL